MTFDHFYTTNKAERDNAISNIGYKDEGIACYVYQTSVSGSIPLYRLFQPSNGDHFYTTNKAERDNAVFNIGYKDEGIACYVYSKDVSGSIPLYRLFQPSSGDHFYTTNKAERDNAISNIGYKDEGIACYVYQSITNCKGGLLWTNYPMTQSLTPYSTCRPNSLAGIAAIIREAEADHKHVHAFGSKWSFSDCAFTNDYVIDTRDLNQEISMEQLKKALKPRISLHLYHVEAGISIRNLYEKLNENGLALETMGGASGQTLAGAISTGTHGGDKFMAPLADSVLAIHLVGAGGTQFWIEPSVGITDPILLKKHVVPDIDPKNIIYDDATFNACLVSLGCMGVIYSVVLRVRKSYDLVENIVRSTWQDFKRNASTYLNDHTTRFLQILLSPYPSPNLNKLNGCLITRRSEANPTEPKKRVDTQSAVRTAVKQMIDSFDLDSKVTLQHKGVFEVEGLTSEQAIAKIVQGVLDWTPNQLPKMFPHYFNILVAQWRTTDHPIVISNFRGSSYSVMDLGYGQSIRNSQPGHSIEMFFPTTSERGKLGFIEFVDYAIEVISQHYSRTFFTGYIALRFTGPTSAYLGMQQWNQTCSIEIAVVQGVKDLPNLLNYLLYIGQEYGGLAHWGQHIDWTRKDKSHGSVYPNYAQWRRIYVKMSNNFKARTFENDLSYRWNLTRPNDAQFVSQTVPDVMEAGQSKSVTVTMKNTGVTTWTRSGSYRLGANISGVDSVFGIKRVELPADVSPGSQVTFQFNIVAPEKGIGAGINKLFNWKMLQESIEWFGLATPLVNIRIVPKSGTNTVVPDIIHIKWTSAKQMILDAFLNPTYTGDVGSDSWVETQSPSAGTVVAAGSTVKVHLRTGLIP